MRIEVSINMLKCNIPHIIDPLLIFRSYIKVPQVDSYIFSKYAVSINNVVAEQSSNINVNNMKDNIYSLRVTLSAVRALLSQGSPQSDNQNGRCNLMGVLTCSVYS